MTWEPEVGEIERRRAVAAGMGGPERVERQHARSKLTARQRLDLLLDAGSFSEIGMLADHQSTRPDMQGRHTPADGVVTGYGRIDGREVLVAAEDFTVMGGSIGITGMRKRHRLIELAGTARVPMVWLFDGAGARANEWVRAGWAGGPHFSAMARLSGVVPTVTAVMGPCAGDPALMAPMTDFVIMVKGTAMLAAAGPAVVQPATGEALGPEELGGSSVHCRVSGVADNEAVDEEECLAMIRRYLGYFPSSAYGPPPVVASGDPPERRDDALLSVVPRSSKQPYDMHRVISSVVDSGSFFEVKPLYGEAAITGLARLDGHSVGVVANQPLRRAGTIDGPAADKITHFIQVCDAFHIPLVFLTDVPGVMVGSHAERAGTLRRAMRSAYALAFVSVPRVSVVLRKAYGMGAVAMCGHESGQILTLVWPSGEFGAMPIEGGVNAATRSGAREGRISEQEQQDLREYYQGQGDAFATAETFNFDDLIDPRDTRPRIIRALALARAGDAPALAPKTRHGTMP